MAMMPTTSKQDRGAVRTATDLERKYDLGAILGIKKAVETNIKGLNKTNAILEQFMAATLGSLENLQKQVDGNITTWFNNGEPTANNYPANEWTTDKMKLNHVGDLYYDRNTGYAYRYESVEDGKYSWEKIKDNDVVEALAIANAASDTADSKRRVFVEQPAPPYDNGDLWFKDGEIYICQISKDKLEQYAEKDFITATKYTDDTYAKQVGEELIVVKGVVTTIKEGMDEYSVMIEILENDLRVAETLIEANTEGIEMSVKKDGIISAINQSAETIKISAKKIELEGLVTADMLDVDELSAINGNLGTVTAGKLVSTDYNEKTGSGMKIDLDESRIETTSEEFVIIFNSQGHYMGYVADVTNGVFFSPDFDTLVGQASLSIEDGKLALNNVNYESYGINYDGVNILNWTTEGIATPKVSTDLIYCNGEMVSQKVVTNDVILASGIAMSQLVNNYKNLAQNVKTIKDDYISRTSGSNLMAYDYECHVIGTAGGSFVYAKFATVRVVNPNYANAPIRFSIVTRGGAGEVSLVIVGTTTVGDYAIAKLEQNGAINSVYAVASGPGVFDLYIDYYGWECASVTRLEMSSYMRGQVAVEWKSEFVSSLPSGYITASKHFDKNFDKAFFDKGVFGGYDATGTDFTLTTKNIIVDQWVRTNGDTGWYSNNYYGGIHMYDYNWIRTYGGKNFYCDQTIMGASVITTGGANLDTLAGILARLTIPDNVNLQFYKVAWTANNTETYGVTMRIGNSTMGKYVDDTYYLTIDYTGALRVGYQLNGATYPTWVEK